jgi:AraC family transcriptional regulator, regulatory protein of adaptative response / DNA-3-methyladenine glycosylase II
VRTVRINHAGDELLGWLEISKAPGNHALRVRFSSSLLKATTAVLSRVKDLTDLSCDPMAVSEVLGSLAIRDPGIRVPGAFDGFEMAIRAILGQQVSVAAARTLAGRLACRFGRSIQTPVSDLVFAFPRAVDIAGEKVSAIADIGVTSGRARSIIALASAVVEGGISLTPASDLETTLRNLESLPGIGQWTAQYIAMRVLRWPDAFPHTDLGVRKALGNKAPRIIVAMADAWRPWRSYAVMHLWRSLQGRA